MSRDQPAIGVRRSVMDLRYPRPVMIRMIRGRRYNLGNHDFKCIGATRMDFAERNAEAHTGSHLNLCNGRR